MSTDTTTTTTTTTTGINLLTLFLLHRKCLREVEKDLWFLGYIFDYKERHSTLTYLIHSIFSFFRFIPFSLAFSLSEYVSVCVAFPPQLLHRENFYERGREWEEKGEGEEDPCLFSMDFFFLLGNRSPELCWLPSHIFSSPLSFPFFFCPSHPYNSQSFPAMDYIQSYDAEA